MGGFTQLYLRDTSIENIERQNAVLDIYGVPKRYRFASLVKSQVIEYEYFKRGLGVFPEHCFPKDKIRCFADFQKYWTPEAIGECFCAPDGVLQFDCYFGRTSKRAMRKLGRYIAENIREFKKFEGSFTTFMERGMTAIERQIIVESGFSY